MDGERVNRQLWRPLQRGVRAASGGLVQAMGPLGAVLLPALLAVLAALVLITGCGPGLGGTGTGATPDALAAQGARSVPVCTAEFADLLDCSAPATGAAPQPAGTTRFFADASPASRTLLELAGQEARWQLRCQGLTFAGSFGQVGNDAPRYYGQVTEAGGSARLATLLVQRSATGLNATLVDSLGASLAGPLALEPVSGVTGEAPCR